MSDVVSGFGGSGVATRVDVGTTPAVVVDRIELAGGAFPLTVSVDSEASYGFAAHAADATVSVVDLQTAETHATEPWLAATGPTYTAVTT
ncbi:MAG: hypothetical protein ACOCXM_06410 [Myxococcota bacterium]